MEIGTVRTSGIRGIIAVACMAAACTAQTGATDPELRAEQDSTATSEQALIIDASRQAIGYDYAERVNMPHGVTGDTRLIFVTEPLNSRVAVLSRVTGQEVASLPQPPGGMILPFAIRIRNDGRLAVLDSGGFPNVEVPAVPRVLDYQYSWNPWTQTFSATLVRDVSFAGYPMVYAEDLEVLDDGRTVVSESVLGQLWIVHADGSIAPGVVPATFAPQDAVPGLNPCLVGTATMADGIPFAVAGNFGPGVGSMAQRAGYLYFGNTCMGGVRKIPIASLEDPTRTPSQRGADITVVSPKLAGSTLDIVKGLTFNKWDPTDSRLVAVESITQRLVRINTVTGARETLIDDPVLLNFPVSAQFLPPVAGLQPVVVSSDQEHRLAALNAAIPQDQFLPPFLLTKVYVGR